MKLQISVVLQDAATPDEIFKALGVAAQLVGYSIVADGVPAVEKVNVIETELSVITSAEFVRLK